MLELYHNGSSTCSTKVRIVLAEKNLEWKEHFLNLRAGDAQAPEYLKLNPNGMVPTLLVDGQAIIESTIICEYLDDAYPHNPLKPASAFDIARMRLWMRQLDDNVHAATSTVSSAIAFRHQHLCKSPEDYEAYFAGIPDPVRREKRRRTIEEGMDHPAFEPAVRRFAKLIADMDAALAHTSYLAADTYSLADVAYTAYMNRLEHLGMDDMINVRPRVADWVKRLCERPTYQVAVKDWEPPDYLAIYARTKEEARERVGRILGTPVCA